MIFREGHQNPAGHREELMMDSRFGEAALTMTLAALVFGFATAAHAQANGGRAHRFRRAPTR
jgi:hypothetical protein